MDTYILGIVILIFIVIIGLLYYIKRDKFERCPPNKMHSQMCKDGVVKDICIPECASDSSKICSTVFCCGGTTNYTMNYCVPESEGECMWNSPCQIYLKYKK